MMVFFTFDDVVRVLQVFQETPSAVSEELRGWRWREPPLLSPYRVRVNASDLSFGCDSGRLAYLRHVARAGEKPGEELFLGLAVHNVIVEASTVAKGVLYHRRPDSGRIFYELMMEMGEVVRGRRVFRGFEKVFDSLWSSACLTYSSCLDRVLSLSRHLGWDGVVYRVVPWVCEFPVDGRPLGLNRAIRVDALIPPSILVEFKTRRPSRLHEVALAGYALSFEAQFRVPVNHALLLYLDVKRDGSYKVFENFVHVDDELRLEFVERRDLYCRVVAEKVDPGLPTECDRYCPYLKICHGEK